MTELEVQHRRPWPILLVEALASSRLALVLVGLVILASVGGATVPQEGRMSSAELAAWQDARPALSWLLGSLGGFHVFTSWPFIVTITLLGVNTLTCTVLRIAREGGIAFFRGAGAVRRTGFVLVHLCLLGLFGGGAWTATSRMDAYIILTEGQSFRESHDAYLQVFEAPLRPERHRDFTVRLDHVRVQYVDKRFPVDVASDLTVLVNGKEATRGAVRVNHPFTFQGIELTQDKTGFSPRLEIRQKRTGRTLAHSFVAFQIFGPEGDREHRDFLPLPFLKERLIMTLYPSHSRADGEVRKTGEEPDNPLLVVETEDSAGEVTDRQYLPMGERIDAGEHTIGFTELRRWSSFRVSEDPGYLVVMISLWLGTIGLVLRYGQEIWSWFGRDSGASAES